MPRQAVAIPLSESERRELERWRRAGKTERRVLTHLPRNDIPSGIFSSNVTFLRATYFVPAICDDRANQFFEKSCIRPMRPENARIRLPAGLASPELGYTG